MKLRFWAATLLTLSVSLAWAVPDKSDVTAAMIYRLTKFVDWPAQAFSHENTPFMICFDTDSPTFRKLSKVALKPWRGREVAVTTGAAPECQVLVVEAEAVTDIGPHTLLVGEDPSFLEDGGHIAFQFTRGRIGFLVNRTSAREQGLELSAELLSLARHVQ